MDLIHRMAEQGAPAGTALVATTQTAGRGSRGREWHSGLGGLWLTLLVRPTRAGAELLSLRAGMAVAGALEAADRGLRLTLKWPNDIMWADRKLGGILCEVRWVGEAPAWAAIGVGINVRNPVPPELAAAALGERWASAGPDDVLTLVLPALRALDTETAMLGAEEHRGLAARDWLRGRTLLEPVPGVAQGISPEGALLVRRPGGSTEAVRSGRVRLADPAGSP